MLMLDIIERQNKRDVENKIEKSVIDYIFMYERMQKFLLEMSIDEDRIIVLCRYKKIKMEEKW